MGLGRDHTRRSDPIGKADLTMAPGEPFAPELDALLGEQVVLDCKGPFLYIGVLDRLEANCFVLTSVDVHDIRESTSSVDLYLIDTLKHGVRANRRRVHVLAREILSISRLADIVPY